MDEDRVNTSTLLFSCRRGTLGLVVLRHFSNFNLQMRYCIFSESARCGVLAFWTVLKIILLVLQRFPSLFQFLIGHSRLMVTVNCNSLCRNRKRVCYFLLIISQHANGCYLFCLFFSKSKLILLNVH